MSDDVVEVSCPVGVWTALTIATGATSVVVGAVGGGLMVRKKAAQPTAGVSYGFGIQVGTEKTFTIDADDPLWGRPVAESSGPVTALVWS